MATTRKSSSEEKKVEKTQEKITDQAYIKIPVPSFAAMKGVNPVLFLLVILFGGVIGFLFLKLQSLEKKVSAAPASNAQEAFVKYADELGMDTKKFSSCLETGKYAQRVADDMNAGSQAGVTGTPATYINGTLVVGAQPFSAFKTIIDQELAKAQVQSLSPFAGALSVLIPQANAQEVISIPSDGTGEVLGGAEGDLGPIPTPIVVKDMKEGSLPLLGNKNAKVSIVEFSDFQCPFCQRFFTDALAKIKTEYVNTGKAKLAFRHYPLSFHPNAQKAAEASECANEQGQFWKYHDILFNSQQAWENLPAATGTTTTQ